MKWQNVNKKSGRRKLTDHSGHLSNQLNHGKKRGKETKIYVSRQETGRRISTRGKGTYIASSASRFPVTFHAVLIRRPIDYQRRPLRS